MRFHVVSLPHTQTTKEYLPCAYTQKVVNFCRMMKSLGHEVFLYASEDNDAPCDEFVTIISKDEQRRTMRPGAENWKKDFFAIDWTGREAYWQIANANAIREIEKRIRERDFICLIAGAPCQNPIAEAFPGHMAVEFGIGYKGVFAKYKVFESYAWMHWVYGNKGLDNGAAFDTVIPNYFDPADFPFSAETEPYYLFVGRMISRKGVETAAEVCRRLGAKLILAGQGVTEKAPGKVVASEITVTGNVEHVGTVDVEARGRLMSRARAVFVPTNYIGPFEGVHAEALLCGTPVITTDWGVFPETVVDGFNGFRTRTLGEAVAAATRVLDFDAHHRSMIRKDAQARWSLDVVRHRYNDYFTQLQTLWDHNGWYADASVYAGQEKRECGGWR